MREWGAREVAPRIHDLDREHRFDPDILPQMAALGLLGVSIPEAYGGTGTDYISLGLASEELEYVDTSLRVILSVHVGLNCLTLLSWGTEDQKRRYLVPQAQGRRIATFGLTEPAAGSDARGIQTVAVKSGDRYVLTGEKMWISLADVADHFLVFAWSDLEKKKQRDPSGISAFIVERAFKGFSSGTLKEKWGILAGNTGFFKMDEVEVPEENVVGRPGEGFKIAMFALDQGRYTVAAGATGLVRACRDASVKYALERKTFGVEIGQHQLVKEMIAQMESDYQASRLLWLRAGWLKNAGRRSRARRAWRSGSPRWRRSAPRATRCRCTARTATRTSTRSAGSTGTQGRGDLRGDARDPQADAGRLPARLPPGPARRCTLPAHIGRGRGTGLTDGHRPFSRVPPRRRARRDRVRAHDGAGRPAAGRSRGGRGDAPRHGRPPDRRHDRDRRRRARRSADALHRRAGRAGAPAPGRPRALPPHRHRRRSARGHQPLRARHARRDLRARRFRAGRPAARARSVHGEADRRAEVEERGRPGRAGRRQPEGDRPLPRAPGRRPRRRRDGPAAARDS